MTNNPTSFLSLYTPQQAADTLSCSLTTINRLVKQGHLTRVYLTSGIKRGGCPRITGQSIQDYIAKLCSHAYSPSCIEASATNQRSSIWQQSTNERIHPVTGAGGKGPTAQELGKKLGVL